MDYELYHDESMVDGFWHGMLLVPQSGKKRLLDLLEKARFNTSYFEPISIKKIRKPQGKIYTCADACIHTCVASLMQKHSKDSHWIFLGETVGREKRYEKFTELIKTKFIVFRERDEHRKMTGHTDYASKVETTFRMGFKGGLHFLGSENEPIRIIKIHFDGHEHLKRKISKERIIGRLLGLRDYCKISDLEDIIDDRTGNHNKNNCQDYSDCQLLQLTDLIIGFFRTILGTSVKDFQIKIAKPV